MSDNEVLALFGLRVPTGGGVIVETAESKNSPNGDDLKLLLSVLSEGAILIRQDLTVGSTTGASCESLLGVAAQGSPLKSCLDPDHTSTGELLALLQSYMDTNAATQNLAELPLPEQLCSANGTLCNAKYYPTPADNQLIIVLHAAATSSVSSETHSQLSIETVKTLIHIMQNREEFEDFVRETDRALMTLNQANNFRDAKNILDTLITGCEKFHLSNMLDIATTTRENVARLGRQFQETLRGAHHDFNTQLQSIVDLNSRLLNLESSPTEQAPCALKELENLDPNGYTEPEVNDVENVANEENSATTMQINTIDSSEIEIPPQDPNVCVVWGPYLETGTRAIDVRHRHVVSLLNQIFGLRLHNVQHLIVKERLTDLRKHLDNGFHTEDVFMNKYEYPGMDDHRDAHAKYLVEFDKHLSRLSNTDILMVTDDVLDLTRRWALEHITAEDRRMGAYLAESAQAEVKAS